MHRRRHGCNCYSHPVKDFEPVVYTHVIPLLLAVHPAVGAKNVQELVTWIRPNPD